jgi:hypothetical protein
MRSVQITVGFVAGSLWLLAGCTPVNSKDVRQAALQGCCQDIYISGICRPNPAAPEALQCQPTEPQKASCIRDPFACDRLNSAPVDPCLRRNPLKGINTRCTIHVTHTAWDPAGLCVKNQCSEAVPATLKPQP